MWFQQSKGKDKIRSVSYWRYCTRSALHGGLQQSRNPLCVVKCVCVSLLQSAALNTRAYNKQTESSGSAPVKCPKANCLANEWSEGGVVRKEREKKVALSYN